MRILIATASRHGSTRELGHWLGSAIAERLYGAMDSVTVEVLDAADVELDAERRPHRHAIELQRRAHVVLA